MKKLKFTVLLLLVCQVRSYSQAVVSEPNQYESTWRKLQVVRNLLNAQDNSNPIDFKDIKGSPYQNKQFQKGHFFVNDESLGTFNLRYNIYSDEIEVIDDNQLYRQNSENLKLEAFMRLDNSKAIINKEIIEFYNYKTKNNISKEGYLIEIVNQKNYKLLLKKRCVLTPAQKAANFNQADRSAKFNIYNDYYILKAGNKKLEFIELKKNKIFKMFSDNESALKKFYKKNQLDLKKTPDLIKLLDYAFSL